MVLVLKQNYRFEDLMLDQASKLESDGDIKGAQSLNERLMPLHIGLFCESSPGPVKYAASLLGRSSAETRLPLTVISKKSKKIVEDAMRASGVLN